MKSKSPFIESLQRDIRLRGYSISTERTYLTWTKRKFFNFYLRTSELSTKRKAALTTILGPLGVSRKNEASKPPQTARQPIRLERIAIFSGELEKALAEAGGMIISEVINKIPTTFMLNAITVAIKSINNKRILPTARPSTCASS